MKFTVRLFIAVALVLLIHWVLIWAFGNLFLEDYYLSHKKTAISGDFDRLFEVYPAGDEARTRDVVLSIEGKNTRVELYAYMEIRWPLMSYSSGYYARIYSSALQNQEENQLYAGGGRGGAGLAGGPFFQRPGESAEVAYLAERLGGSRAAFLETSGTPGPQTAGQLQLFGRLDDNTVALLQTPLDSVRESAALATRFSLLSGVIALCAGIVVTLLMSMVFTRPLRQITAVAEDIARLDFSRRVPLSEKAKRRSGDELQTLGESVNTMADALERNHQALSEYNRQLRRDIDERILTEQAQKALVSNISHELKTPLSIISGYAEGLQEGLAADEAACREYCGVILEESRNMTRLIQSLLRLTRLQSGFIEPSPSDVDMAALSDRILSALGLQAQRKGISIERDYSGNCRAWADADACEQVCRNYLVNALSHTPEGGRIKVTLCDATEDRAAPGLRLEVYNSGSRVEEADLPRIWDSFYRADAARRREEGEVGLGLAIVKAHITAHGGAFGCVNVDDGVVFYAEFSTIIS
ncbi:MAG: HAMP domain-containing histidine kinase [Oscillospiraceae bacterium]|nr:HAMP domain-containing histidine kinase [Oscillospiraceae bacterium]